MQDGISFFTSAPGKQLEEYTEQRESLDFHCSVWNYSRILNAN